MAKKRPAKVPEDAAPTTPPKATAEDGTEITAEERARRRRFYEKLKQLQGKIHLDIDIDELRGRNRR